MDMQEMASRLTRANSMADETLGNLRSYPYADRGFIEDTLRQYIASKLLLSEDEISDNIIMMVRINVAKAANMTIEELKEMDRPGVCGSAPTVLAKRVLLFLAIQKGLDIIFPVQEVSDIHTIQDLADVIVPLIQI